MGITAASLVNIAYGTYALANSYGNSAQSGNENDLTKSLYNVSNLANALSSLKNSANIDGMATVSAYAKNSFMLSQSQLYNSSGTINPGLIAGTAYNYSNLNYLAQSSNLAASNVNLNGITNVQDFTNNSALIYKIGSLFDKTA